ncbi:WbqC family protein [Paenibacillus eucommiae]|uniref:WbqC-like protein family protein n=1 Tax=Paenibacillus eucommiae TaxID=1355755 RepID=A0ABS4IUG0_9BACL|nr:WbqC family protein [Paenibacillus eucommiae]MBP1991138.1 hypothetical protein [Paenibacillus eucommiae]
MNTVAVLQSNYIPWKGYFDIINDVDIFIFYDDVQYTKNDWRNRNRIKTSNGTQWLTIPVGSHNEKLICEVGFSNLQWGKKHYTTLQANYSRSPYYKKYNDFFQFIYLDKNWESLSEFNQYVIKTISSEFLGIKTEFVDSRNFNTSDTKLDRLINLLVNVRAEKYVSGPAAKDYIIESYFSDRSIELCYKNYQGYPQYKQLFDPFDHYVSIIDLLFNTGEDAPYFIWGWREIDK